MAEEIRFYPLNQAEAQKIQQLAMSQTPEMAHRDFTCACGQPTNGRVVSSLRREIDGATIWMCICSCPNREAVILTERGGNVISQIPEAREFQVDDKWPPDLAQLFEEASKAFAAGAYTVSTMACRKLLMACACHEGDEEGKQFGPYVDYIVNKVLTFPKAKDAIDKIRTIGNEANHKIRFVQRDDARRALSIVTYMLNTIYSLPSA